MSDFEFVSVVLAIVIGLGMTRILSGLGSALEHRSTLRSDWIVLTWAVMVLLWQILFWLGTVNSARGRPVFTVANFGMLLLAAVALFFASTLVLPSQIGPATDLREHYRNVKKPFFLVVLALPLLELCDSAVNRFQHPLSREPEYFITQATIVLGCTLSLAKDNRRLHGTFAVVSLLWLVGWLFTQLFVI
jgi:hypothetical protein